MSSSSSGSKPSTGWQPPSLEEMQAMLPLYHFEKLLGRGGMGAVYKAVQASLDRPVAIKVLPADLVSDDDEAQFVERFKNEARTMAKMSHPSIVNVFDFGETPNGLLYIVMEFINGTDVHQMIATQGKLPEDYALSITAHVCDALAYAHKNGVIHRDIKPANILINMDGAVKVADFGLAKQSDAGQSGLTKTNMAMGTPDFVAPEAFIPGVPLDGRADLYAIGVMLYQMLTGEIPRGIWTMPAQKVGSDPRFDAIIAKAMQTDREARYQSAAEIRQALDTILTLPRSALIAQQQAAAEAAAKATRAQKEAEAAPPAKKTPTPPTKPKSSLGPVIGIAATIILGGGLAFLFLSGGNKPPADKVMATQKKSSPLPKPSTPPPAKPATKPATPKPPLTATPAPPVFNESVPRLGTKAVDLLPGINLDLDKLAGQWSRKGGGIAYDSRSGDLNARLQIPVSTTGGYTLDVELSANPTPGDVVLFLPFAKGGGDEFQNTAFIVHHDNKGAHKAGFVHFNNQPAWSRNTPGWVNLEKPLGAKSRITVQVLQPAPDRLALKAWVNGRPLVAWEGPRSETSGGSRVWRPANPGYFAFGTTWEDTVFHRMRLEVVDGEIAWLRTPVVAATAAPTKPATAATTAPAVSPVPAPAPDPVSERLAGLERQFFDAYEKAAGAAHKAAVADLNAKYSAALDRALATASQAGKLDEAVILRNEKTLVQTSAAVPDSDDDGTPGSLKALRKTWREQMAVLIAKREQAAAPVHAGYDRLLAAYQDELTKAQQLDAATRVKAVRDHIVAQRESGAPQVAPVAGNVVATAAPDSTGKMAVPIAPVMPPLPADKVLPPLPPATQEEIRSLCEWALQKDGKVRLRISGSDVEFAKGETLPKGRLLVVHVGVYDLSFDPKDDEQKWFALMGRLPDLESIGFNKNSGTMPVELLRGATKLKSLRLTPTSVDDAAFAHLAGLKNLESFEITYMVKQFTGTGLGYINPNLLSFSTSSPTLTAQGLAQLPRFKKLKKLIISGDSLGGRTSTLTDADFGVLAALIDLEELDVNGRAGLDGSFLAHLPANSKLKRLYLQETSSFKPGNLKHLARLKNLEELSLPPVDISAEVAGVLAGLGNLRVLTLNSNTVFTGESLQKVKGFRSLRDLDVNVCPLTDAGLEAISNAMPELFLFRMNMEKRSKATITPEGFSKAFRRQGMLASVQFNGEKITDDWLPHIAQLKAVDYLMLTSAQITDQALAPLMKLPLGYLRLDGTPVTDAVIPILKTCPTLNNVPVGGTKMTDAGKQALLKMLESNRK